MKNRYPIFAAILLALGVAGYTYMRQEPSPAPVSELSEQAATPELAAANSKSEPAPQQVAKQQPDPSRTENQKPSQASYYGIAVNEDLDVPPAAQKRMALTLPGAIDHRIRQQDPVMDEILLLTRDKVLRSSADKDRIAELYRSEPMLMGFAQSLGQKPGNNELYRDDLQLRLHRLHFVGKALTHGDGLDKAAIVNRLKAAFAADTIEAGYPLHQKKSLTFEKIELLKLIERHDPGYAASVRQTVHQRPNPKVYQYILSQL